GITLLECLGKIPIGSGQQIAMQAMINRQTPPLAADLPSPLKALVEGGLTYDWRRRLTAEQALTLLGETVPISRFQSPPELRSAHPVANPPIEPALSDPVVRRQDGSEMILIPAGEFSMGDLDLHDAPRKRVYLDAYYIAKTPVTVSQYLRFCR